MAVIKPDLRGAEGSKILCAVSGGADSVALLTLLAAERDAGRIELAAAHFEHGIRGEESLNDMQFTKELCERLNVPLYIGSADIPKEAEKRGIGLEECARELRHAYLRRVMREEACDFIATAHHRRDKAETVLMHILRGGGVSGAAALPRISGFLIRPLIDYSPEELREFLSSIGQEWREDSTNFVADNPRNALRLNVFPLLSEIYPGFEKALSRFSEISGAEDEYISAESRRFIEQSSKKYNGITVLPKTAHPAILYRSLKAFLPKGCGYENILAASRAAGYTDMGGGWRVFGTQDELYIVPPDREAPEVTVVSEPSPGIPIRNNGPVQVLAESAADGCVLRYRQTGDFMRPLGMKGSKLLSDIFTDKKIPLPLRDRIPVLAKGNEVIWLVGVCVSESARVTADTKAVKLSIIMEDTLHDAR